MMSRYYMSMRAVIEAPKDILVRQLWDSGILSTFAIRSILMKLASEFFVRG
jgi:hypothetical protein